MKRLYIVLGVMALLAAALSVSALNSASQGANQLVVDFVNTVLTPGTSGTLETGERGYNAGDVYEEGQFGVGAPIGEFMRSFVSTEDGGPGASIGQAVFRIFGEGDIYVSDIFEVPAAGVLQFEGVITGASGEFRVATGEFSAINVTTCTCPPPLVWRATFTFNQGQK